MTPVYFYCVLLFSLLLPSDAMLARCMLSSRVRLSVRSSIRPSVTYDQDGKTLDHANNAIR